MKIRREKNEEHQENKMLRVKTKGENRLTKVEWGVKIKMGGVSKKKK